MPSPRALSLHTLPGRFAICRLAPDAAIPAWATAGAFFSVTKTDEELSIVCPQELAAHAPAGTPVSADWACLKLAGPVAFDETGIVAALSSAIAAAGLGVFVLSTFDGDHLLVQQADYPAAVQALRGQGHTVHP
ncbi:ACT domain-containing protein [Vandammella animalimorsus]|uniref:ACT domain-containing protein n=1 Tax=Vandammella animalimorsus TaxID=2029117 RepID=A0A3M6RJB4_9BURK|nr:ACT domain-containing protein [Vandammella animalimorsus]RMX15401.1 ACT domain-containing protein [Vandammella animalimorsus]